jgi:hypothetical protein
MNDCEAGNVVHIRIIAKLGFILDPKGQAVYF